MFINKSKAADYGSFYTHFSVWVMLMIKDLSVAMKCKTAIKALFLYFNV